MPFRNYNVNVGQSATLVYEHEAGDIEVWIRSSGDDRFGGDDQVSLANGQVFNHGGGGQIFHTQVNPTDEIWTIREQPTGTSAIRVLVRKE